MVRLVVFLFCFWWWYTYVFLYIFETSNNWFFINLWPMPLWMFYVCFVYIRRMIAGYKNQFLLSKWIYLKCCSFSPSFNLIKCFRNCQGNEWQIKDRIKLIFHSFIHWQLSEIYELYHNPQNPQLHATPSLKKTLSSHRKSTDTFACL